MTKHKTAEAADPLIDKRTARRVAVLAARDQRVQERQTQQRDGDERIADIDRTGRQFLQGFAATVGELSAAVNRLVDAVHVSNNNTLAVESVRAEVTKLRDAAVAAEARRLEASADSSKRYLTRDDVDALIKAALKKANG